MLGYMRGQSNFSFWQIVASGKSAEFILQLLPELAKNTNRAHVVSITKWKGAFGIESLKTSHKNLRKW